MRILQIVTKRQFRGAEVFASILASDLAGRGHQVLFLGLYSPPPEPLTASGTSNFDLLVAPGSPLQAVYRLYRFVRDHRPDVIQCNGSDTLKYTCLALKLIRHAPPIVYRNISMISHWVNTPAKKWVYRWLFGSVKMVVSVSDASRADFVNLIKKRNADVVTIKNVITIKRGVDLPTGFDRTQARKDLNEAFPVLQGQFVLLHVGAMTGEKNHPGLLRVLKEIVAHVAGVFLVCLGDGPGRAALDELVAHLGLHENVLFAGYQTDPSRFYLAADLLLLPSRIEGIPGVVLEAAAFQTPTVAYRVGGMEEAIVQRETGVIVEDDDECAMAAEAVRLLRNEAARLRMGKAAREYVEKHYNRDVTVDQFEKLYRSLV